MLLAGKDPALVASLINAVVSDGNLRDAILDGQDASLILYTYPYVYLPVAAAFAGVSGGFSATPIPSSLASTIQTAYAALSKNQKSAIDNPPQSRKPRVGRSYIVKRFVVRSNIATWFDSATVNHTRSFWSTRIVCG